MKLMLPCLGYCNLYEEEVPLVRTHACVRTLVVHTTKVAQGSHSIVMHHKGAV